MRLLCRLLWKIALLLLDRCPILRWCANILAWRWSHCRTSSLLVAGGIRSNWRSLSIRISRIWRACAHGVVRGEVGHDRGAGMLAWKSTTDGLSRFVSSVWPRKNRARGNVRDAHITRRACWVKFMPGKGTDLEEPGLMIWLLSTSQKSASVRHA